MDCQFDDKTQGMSQDTCDALYRLILPGRVLIQCFGISSAVFLQSSALVINELRSTGPIDTNCLNGLNLH